MIVGHFHHYEVHDDGINLGQYYLQPCHGGVASIFLTVPHYPLDANDDQQMFLAMLEFYTPDTRLLLVSDDGEHIDDLAQRREHLETLVTTWLHFDPAMIGLLLVERKL